MTRRHRFAISFVLGLVAAAGALFADRPVDRTVPAEPDVTIEIESLSGSVVVRGWDRDEVRITGTVGDDTDGLRVDGGPDRLDIEVEIPDQHDRGHGHRELSADLELSVPRSSRIRVEVVSATIEASGLDGEVDFSTVSGSIQVSGDLDRAELETVSGDIDLRGEGDTRVEAATVNGSITIGGASGAVEASTVNGDITVTADVVDHADFESVSGDVELTSALARDANVEVETHSGDVVLRLPADVEASFRVETFSGNVRNELGPAAKKTGRYTPEKRLEFSTGSWDARVSIQTFSGDVSLVEH